MVSAKYLARRFLRVQQFLEEGCLGDEENPADGLAEVRSDLVPLLRLLESGRFFPGQLRPLRSVAWKEWVIRVALCDSFCTCACRPVIHCVGRVFCKTAPFVCRERPPLSLMSCAFCSRFLACLSYFGV